MVINDYYLRRIVKLIRICDLGNLDGIIISGERYGNLFWIEIICMVLNFRIGVG